MRYFAFFLLLLAGCQSPAGQTDGRLFTNHLADETSPYLLQHAHNPVDWHPWGEKALKKAKEENKMLLISVGYAACHWCHVMERESFMDTAVARIMNEHFVNIKVDREERPDVDDVYMTACQIAGGQSCGWPLNAFTLPDGRPVWAGTYFPRKQWMEILDYFVQVKKNEPQKLEQYAERLTQGVAKYEGITPQTGRQEFTSAWATQVAGDMIDGIDLKKGGRQGAPKFPLPNSYEFLLAFHHRTGDEKALKGVKATLDNMAAGGIYDHLGGGFARYSTDDEWKVPHFEKMLYDNGQIVSLYAEAYKLTADPLYKQVAEETLAFVKRELTSPEGGFYASIDADSEGEEGRFYVWQKTEIDSILDDPKAAAVFADFFEIKEKGNWEGKNILYRRKTAEQICRKYNLSSDELDRMIRKAKEKLFAARSQRVRPALDDKILTSWNSLMLKGFVDACHAFGNEEYLEAALKNGRFISDKMMQEDFRLNRNYKDGKSSINGFLDDYALTIQAFITLYEATFEEAWLYKADGLAQYALKHFSDIETGMFYYTSDLDPPLVVRKRELSDNVIPGSNSAMARGLFYLGLYLYKEDYLTRARQMMHNMAPVISESAAPHFYSNWLLLHEALVRPPFEVAVIGPDFDRLRRQMMSRYQPNAIFLGGADEGSLELLKNKKVDGETLIYVCVNKVCKLPVREVEEAWGLMVPDSSR